MPHTEQVPTAGSQVMEDGASALHLFHDPLEMISAPHCGTRGQLCPRAMMEVPHDTFFPHKRTQKLLTQWYSCSKK